MKRGLFITIEKTADKMGGSTQVIRLTKALQKLGIQTDNIKTTREPGGTPLGEQLRHHLLGKEPLAPATELLLFVACRAQLYHEVLKPALEAGHIVICDRFFDSTLAYQGASGWDRETMEKLHEIATGFLIPDITFVLHGTPHRARSSEDRFEARGDEYYQRVRQIMLDLASSSERYVLINANQPPEVITGQMVRILQERFPDVFTLQK